MSSEFLLAWSIVALVLMVTSSLLAKKYPVFAERLACTVLNVTWLLLLFTFLFGTDGLLVRP